LPPRTNDTFSLHLLDWKTSSCVKVGVETFLGD
jgi:hypothetical protein